MSAFYNPAMHQNPNPSVDEIEAILMRDPQYALEQQLKAMDEHHNALLQNDSYIEYLITGVNKPFRPDRRTHCWNCKDLRLDSAVHEVCKKCGWIKCPTCGRCSPSCKGH